MSSPTQPPVFADKSTVEQIRQRFDNDVERFSVLETGQSATMDAPLVLDLIARAAAAATPGARRTLDVGCGAGNYTLKLLEQMPDLDATLIDLSRPMLDRAKERVQPATRGEVLTVQDDVRNLEFPPKSFDVIVAAAVLHHLRGEEEWRAVFAKFHRWLRPGGSVWVSDLVEHSLPAVHAILWQKYGDHLRGLRDEAYRDAVFAYIAQEDTPRPLMFQLDLLKTVGFDPIEVLHKNCVFAAYGAVRGA